MRIKPLACLYSPAFLFSFLRCLLFPSLSTSLWSMASHSHHCVTVIMFHKVCIINSVWSASVLVRAKWNDACESHFQDCNIHSVYTRIYYYHVSLLEKYNLCLWVKCVCVCVCVHTQSCLTLCDPVHFSLSGSSILGLSQAIILSGLPFPSPGDLPDPGIQPRSLAL